MDNDRPTIRPATLEDIPTLSALIDATWPGEGDAAQIGRALAWPEALTLVAEGEGLLGFIAAFLTVAPEGERRWELDLMAVGEAARGRGIATRLVAAALDAGATRGATVARGLIAEANVASQRTLARHGFAPGGSNVTPYIAEGTPLDEGAGEAEWLLPVETLTYAGLWIEPPLDITRLDAARRHPLARGRAVGALLPVVDESLRHAAEALGFHLLTDGQPYRWWETERQKSKG